MSPVVECSAWYGGVRVNVWKWIHSCSTKAFLCKVGRELMQRLNSAPSNKRSHGSRHSDGVFGTRVRHLYARWRFKTQIGRFKRGGEGVSHWITRALSYWWHHDRIHYWHQCARVHLERGLPMQTADGRLGALVSHLAGAMKCNSVTVMPSDWRQALPAAGAHCGAEAHVALDIAFKVCFGVRSSDAHNCHRARVPTTDNGGRHDSGVQRCRAPRHQNVIVM